ncbi:hypothetical protein KPH14_010339 [Odynerus spinipes]|uniref:Uncharacterized protein n=1 Tax=Odynerus spinipes TaxID=1348599 RepID=A0AAD9RV08_9HYME|nr:hypothetical protein KPH14_010339 [Odynerus spinipes]
MISCYNNDKRVWRCFKLPTVGLSLMRRNVILSLEARDAKAAAAARWCSQQRATARSALDPTGPHSGLRRGVHSARIYVRVFTGCSLRRYARALLEEATLTPCAISPPGFRAELQERAAVLFA